MHTRSPKLIPVCSEILVRGYDCMVVGLFDLATRYSLFDTFLSFLFCTRIWVFLGKDPAPFSLVDEPTNLLGNRNCIFLLYLQFFFNISIFLWFHYYNSNVDDIVGCEFSPSVYPIIIFQSHLLKISTWCLPFPDFPYTSIQNTKFPIFLVLH